MPLTKQKKALGKGLYALIDAIPQSEEGVIEVDIQKVVPNKEQPRKEFDNEKLEELSKSIKEHGIIQPILVKNYSDGYQIIAGERRWRAAMKAGLHKIPVIVRDLSDEKVMEIALIENLQREDLKPIEEALAYKELMNAYRLTQSEIAKKLGKSRVHIANTLRLLQLPEKVQKLIEENKITPGHGRAILSVNEEYREDFAEKIIKDKMSVREAESFSKKIGNIKINYKLKNTNEKKDPFIKELEDKIQRVIGTKVNIKYKNSKGKIEIEYYSDDDLERIVQQISR